MPLKIVRSCETLYPFAAGYVTLEGFAVFEHVLPVTFISTWSSHSDDAYALELGVALEYF